MRYRNAARFLQTGVIPRIGWWHSVPDLSIYSHVLSGRTSPAYLVLSVPRFAEWFPGAGD